MRAQRTSLPGSFWRLWGATASSNLGDGVYAVALPLLATQLTDDPLQIALVAAASAVPALLFSLPAGAVVDRHDRRRLMIRADVFRFALMAAFAVVAATDGARIWMLWLVAFALGVAEVVFDNASQALMPALVESSQLDLANGRRYSAETTTNLFIGTPLGGVLLATAIWLPFGVNALSFLVAALLVTSIRGSFQASTTRLPTTMRREIGEGVRWLWSNRVLRALAGALFLVNIGFQIPQALFVLYARDELGIADQWYGVVLGIMGVGAILGGLSAARIVERIGQVFAIYSAVVIWALAIATYAVIPNVVVITVAAGLLAFATTVWNVVSVSLRQQIVPARLFGRVNSVFRWFALGSAPLGAVAGGLLARAVGLRPAYAIAAGIVVAAIPVLLTAVNGRALARELDVAARRRAMEGDPTPQRLFRDPLFD